MKKAKLFAKLKDTVITPFASTCARVTDLVRGKGTKFLQLFLTLLFIIIMKMSQQKFGQSFFLVDLGLVCNMRLVEMI